MAKGINRLKAGHLKKKGPAKLCDGGGLWLFVNSDNARSWVFRYRLNGKDKEIGLGSLHDTNMTEARKLAKEYRAMKKKGIDPAHHKKAKQQTDANVWTFDRCAEAYIESHSRAWKNEKHIQQWKNTIEQYCSPVFGDMPVDQIDTGLVMQVIEPLWQTRTETASRVRGRIENILSWATVRGYREGMNPAIWRGHLATLLPQRNKVQKPKHFAAMPYQEVGAFMAELKPKISISAKALQFTILTAARTSEVIGASWDEFDLDAGIWTIPEERMKADREHRVPLSKQALTLLDSLPSKDGWLFPSIRYGQHIGNMAMLLFLKRDMKHPDLTVHGFRSSFRDWCAEQTNYPRELAESALAHVLTDKTEAAYQRGDLLEKRRKLMQAWADYCDVKQRKASVTGIREKRNDAF